MKIRIQPVDRAKSENYDEFNLIIESDGQPSVVICFPDWDAAASAAVALSWGAGVDEIRYEHSEVI